MDGNVDWHQIRPSIEILLKCEPFVGEILATSPLIFA